MKTKNKRKKENHTTEKIFACFCIALMISLTFASAESLAIPHEKTWEELQKEQNDAKIQPIAKDTDKNDNQPSSLFSFSSLFSLNILPSVEAAALPGCCVKEKGTTGAYCKKTTSDKCETGYEFYDGQECSNRGIEECRTSVCIQNDGTCDSATYQQKCLDNGGYPSTETDITKIEGCKATCCIFKATTGETIMTEYHFYKKTCETKALKNDLTLTTRDDLNYYDCITLTPPEREGYCRTAEECTFSTKTNCDKINGQFSLDRCANCMNLEAKTKCSNGDVYYYNNCGGKEALREPKCTLNMERCNQTTSDSANCIDIDCKLKVSFTTLRYDTVFFKSGEVGIFTKNEANNGNKKTPTDEISLKNGETACVQYQGPGESHYTYICNGGDLSKIQLDPQRGKVCYYNTTEDIAAPRLNNYTLCSTCGLEKDYTKAVPNEIKFVLDLLGIDIWKVPYWYDYYGFLGTGAPGLCDGNSDTSTNCNNGKYGDCKHDDKTNDCVPKYAPATNDFCYDCVNTTASGPWLRCSEADCYSRGYCKYEKKSFEFGSSLLICVMNSATSNVISMAIDSIFSGPEQQEGKNKQQDANQKRDFFQNFLDRLGSSFAQIGNLFTFAGVEQRYNTAKAKLEKAKKDVGSFIDSTTGEVIPASEENVKKVITENGDKLKEYLLKNGDIDTGKTKELNPTNKKDQTTIDLLAKYGKAKSQLDKIDTYRQAQGNYAYESNNLKQKGLTIVDQSKLKQDYDSAESNVKSKGAELENSKKDLFIQLQSKKSDMSVEQAADTYTGFKNAQEADKSAAPLTTGQKTNAQTYFENNKNNLNAIGITEINKPALKVVDTYITTKTDYNAAVSARDKAETAYRSTLDSPDYYRYSQRLNPSTLAEKQSQAKGYWDSYWESVGGVWSWLGGTLLQVAVNKGTMWLISQISKDLLPNILSLLSYKYYVKWALCQPYALFGGPVGFNICMINPWIMPMTTCLVDNLVNVGGGVFQGISANTCTATNVSSMPGIKPGYDDCHLCNEDPNKYCTEELCHALSADGAKGCTYTTGGQCKPNEDMISKCTENAAKKVKINSPADVYTIPDIEWNVQTYKVEIITNKYAECRYSTNKDAKKAEMSIITDTSDDRTHHYAVFDIGKLNYKIFTYYVQCWDGCKEMSQMFTNKIGITLKKKEKPDTEGPIVTEKSPAANEIIEATSSPDSNVMLKIVTDENALCKYKETPEYASLAGLQKYIDSVKTTAQTKLEQGASEKEISDAISLNLGFESLTYALGDNNYKKEHSAIISLKNGNSYAFYVLCQDKYIENGVEKHNLAEIPTIIRFRLSQPFTVTIIEPTGTITEPQPEIKVDTSLRAFCRYSLENKESYSAMTEFTETGTRSHSTVLNEEVSGSHKIFVTCLDETGGNIASDSEDFTVMPDLTAPKIVRAYQKSGTIANALYIATNEPTTCQYNTKDFYYGSGLDTTGNEPASREHEAEWNTEFTYYIICKDKFGNQGSTLTVKPLKLGR